MFQRLQKPLRIINTYCQSLQNKNAEFLSPIGNCKPYIIIGTESWLNNNIFDVEYFPDNFNVYRNYDFGLVKIVAQASQTMTAAIHNLERKISIFNEADWNQFREYMKNVKIDLENAYEQSNANDL